MSLARLFARLRSRSMSRSFVGGMPDPAARRRRTQRTPQVESLEDRTLLSGWVVNAVGNLDDPNSVGVATDSAGNVYVTGNFVGTASFGAAGSLTSAGGDDIFVAKYTSAGVPVWTRRAGGVGTDLGKGIAIDLNGNVYVTGQVSEIADFGSVTVTSVGQGDIFVTKLDTAGNFLWTVSAGGTTSDLALGIAVDSTHNVLTAGGFQGTADFDPGSGTYNLSSAGSSDAFVWKLDTDGTFLWADRAGSTEFDIARGIALDAVGNVYTTGRYLGTVDFDPGAGFQTLTSSGGTDIFIWKLDSAGNSVMARSMGAPEYDQAKTVGDEGMAIAIDGSGNIYTSGKFFGNADFDPGSGSTVISGYGCDRTLIPHVFLSKLDASGSFVWARAWTDWDPVGVSGIGSNYPITVDSSGNVYLGGLFRFRADFDPGPSVALLSRPSGGTSAFVVKLDSGGSFLWVRQATGSESNYAAVNGLAATASGDLYAVGGFSGPSAATFDIGGADASVTSSSTPTDFFIWSFAETAATSAVIQGLVFNDSNNNGVYDPGEARLQGWTVYLDTNNNGMLDTGEPLTTSGNFGEYSFRHLAAGTYVVREIVQTGWTETLPASGSVTVTLGDGQFAEQSFGNFNPVRSPAGWMATPSGCQDQRTGLIWRSPDSESHWGFWGAQDSALNTTLDGYDDYGVATLKQMQTAVANGLLAQVAVGGTRWSATLGANKDAWAFDFASGAPVLGSSTLCGCRGLMFVRGPGAVHSDNGDANYSDTVTGWSTITGLGEDGDYRVRAPGSGADKATWSFGVQPAGQYKVLATWVAASSNGNRVPFKVFDGATVRLSTTVNQRNAPSSKQNGISIAWADLGTVTTTGGVIKVELNNNANGNVIADMVRLVPIQGTATAAMVATRDTRALSVVGMRDTRAATVDAAIASHFRHDRDTHRELIEEIAAIRERLHRLHRRRA